MPLDSISVTQLISAPFIKVVSDWLGTTGGKVSTIGVSTVGLHARIKMVISTTIQLYQRFIGSILIN